MTAGCGLSTRSPRRLWSTPWSASRCCPTLAPHLSLHIPPGTCTAQLHSQHASHVHLTCISPPPHLHCTRPPLHTSLACRPPGVRQTADYPSTPIRGREAIDSCDRQVEVVLVVVVVLARTPLLSSCCRCCNYYHHHHHTQVGIQVCACEDELGQVVYLYKLPEPPAAHSAYCTSAGT